MKVENTYLYYANIELDVTIERDSDDPNVIELHFHFNKDGNSSGLCTMVDLDRLLKGEKK